VTTALPRPRSTLRSHEDLQPEATVAEPAQDELAVEFSPDEAGGEAE